MQNMHPWRDMRLISIGGGADEVMLSIRAGEPANFIAAQAPAPRGQKKRLLTIG